MIKHIFAVSIITNILNGSAAIPIPASKTCTHPRTEFHDTTHHYYTDSELQSIKQKLIHDSTATHQSVFNGLSQAIKPKVTEKIDLKLRYQQVALLTECAVAIRNAHCPKSKKIAPVSRYTLDLLTGEWSDQLSTNLDAPFPKASPRTSHPYPQNKYSPM